MNNILDCFMNENNKTFAQYFEQIRETKLKKRIDFFNIRDEQREIFERYPVVRELFEDEKAKGFSNEELEAISEIFRLETMQTNLELKEAFKLGAKEMLIFMIEQDLSNLRKR